MDGQTDPHSDYSADPRVAQLQLLIIINYKNNILFGDLCYKFDYSRHVHCLCLFSAFLQHIHFIKNVSYIASESCLLYYTIIDY